jgi:hypothetical protein
MMSHLLPAMTLMCALAAALPAQRLTKGSRQRE